MEFSVETSRNHVDFCSLSLSLCGLKQRPACLILLFFDSYRHVDANSRHDERAEYYIFPCTEENTKFLRAQEGCREGGLLGGNRERHTVEIYSDREESLHIGQ